MSLSEIIEKRRAVFPDQHNDRPIEKEILQEILSAANWAPTHKRTEPWRFKVFQGKSKLDLGKFIAEKYKETAPKFSKFKYEKTEKKFQKSTCVIAICCQFDQKKSLPEWEEIAATAMAVQNMWLKCTELGIGCYWSSPETRKFFGEFTELSEGEECLGFFYMGYFDGVLPEGKRNSSIAEKIQWME
ncbi:MAG TPA: nitroreductase [Flavobacteriaceae bacterium]|nr:nitroreductase [Flavobacteriaceae bacterium]